MRTPARAYRGYKYGTLAEAREVRRLQNQAWHEIRRARAKVGLPPLAPRWRRPDRFARSAPELPR
jgi:hypothetical protein